MSWGAAFVDQVLIPHVLTWPALGALAVGLVAPFVVQAMYGVRGRWVSLPATQKKYTKQLSALSAGFLISMLYGLVETVPLPVLIATGCVWGAISMGTSEAFHKLHRYTPLLGLWVLRRLGLGDVKLAKRWAQTGGQQNLRIDREPGRIVVRDNDTDETILGANNGPDDH